MQWHNNSAFPVATIQLRLLRGFVLNQSAPFAVVRSSIFSLEAEDLPSTFGQIRATDVRPPCTPPSIADWEEPHIDDLDHASMQDQCMHTNNGGFLERISPCYA